MRPIETEQLYERAWFAVTETCLAMTIFRGELGGWFLVMFISLLVGKVWGWIGEGRVEYLEQQPPANPRFFHTRLAISLVLAVLFNAFMLQYCVNTVIHQARPDMMVMFGFEFAILTILSTSTTARYGIALMEIYVTRQQVRTKLEERRAEIRAAREDAIRESARAGESSPPTDLPNENDVNELEVDVPGWEEKGRWVFYLDLVTDFVKLVVYVIFFAILLTFYGLPIHILRDVVVTIRSFVRRILDFLRYRNATRDMNERYPDATAEEVVREEVCIICREEMHAVHQAPGAAGGGDQPAAGARRVPDRLRPKKLPCGHILHFACLRSWLERQQNCPTCRRPVIGAQAGTGANANVADRGPDGQQNVAGGNQMPGRPGGQGDGPPRARVYQFGPFRIGFGAVRGDLFHNLHQQIHQGHAPLQPAANANPRGARQIGFGFGFGRRPAAQPPQNQNAMPAPYNFEDIHAQLQQVEQRITQEINTLRIATEQLRRVRELQLELERLRLQEASPFFQPTTPTPTTSASMPHGITTFPTGQHFDTNPDSAPIVAGDPRLPEGLQLPAGWTMVPLQGAGIVQQGLNTDPTSTVPSVNSAPAGPSPSQPQGEAAPEISITNGDQDNTAQATNNTGASGKEAVAVDWSTPPTSTTAPRTDSPSQDWTEVQSEAGPSTSTIPISWGNNGQAKESAEPDNLPSEDSSKGKGRAATVEEAADQDAS